MLKAISLYGEEWIKPVTTPIRNKLRVNNKTIKEKFCRTVMLLMHVIQRKWKDIQPTVSFLSTWVILLIKENDKKLKRLMRHIIGSIDKLLYLRVNDLPLWLIFIDTVYRVHNNMTRYTRGTSTFGQSVFSSILSK